MRSIAGAIADDPRCVSIHPAIDHALSACAPRVGRRADEVIRAMLAERLASDEPDAWGGSRLTGDGFPFEVAFCTSDDRLRFTLEPGAIDLDPRRRLDVASELIDQVSEVSVPRELLDDLRAMQSDAPLKYGGWIGCRIGEPDSTFKLYVEVPPGGRTEAFDAAPLARGDRAVVPRMIAYTPTTKVFESYVRVPSLEPHNLPAELARAGMEAQAPWLLDFVEEAYGHAVRGRLPGPSVGVSYVSGPTPPRVTLHFYARALWGSDARIRRGFWRIARTFGWDAQVYLDVTAPIAERESWRCFHGLFGITLDRSSPTSLTIGVRPVAP